MSNKIYSKLGVSVGTIGDSVSTVFKCTTGEVSKKSIQGLPKGVIGTNDTEFLALLTTLVSQLGSKVQIACINSPIEAAYVLEKSNADVTILHTSLEDTGTLAFSRVQAAAEDTGYINCGLVIAQITSDDYKAKLENDVLGSSMEDILEVLENYVQDVVVEANVPAESQDSKLEELAEVKELLSTTETVLTSLQGDYDQLNSEKEALVAELNELKVQLESAPMPTDSTSDLEAAHATIESLKDSLSKSEDTVAALTQELDEVKAVLAQQVEEVEWENEEPQLFQEDTQGEEVQIPTLKVEEVDYDETRGFAPSEEPVEETTEEPIEEPVEETTEEPIEEPAEGPVEETTEEPVEETTEEPVEETTEEPVGEATKEPIEEPVGEPVEETTSEGPLADREVICPTDGMSLAYIKAYPDKYPVANNADYPEYEFYMIDGDPNGKYYQYHIPTQDLILAE